MAQIRMECGRIAFRKDDIGYGLHKGKGNRTYQRLVMFDNTFPTPPNIIVALSMFDVGGKSDNRVVVRKSFQMLKIAYDYISI